jgi:CRP-like cAMP-binding protein|nr:MAG TPA: tail assembly chaperone protein [Caudoviricetes sp.]
MNLVEKLLSVDRTTLTEEITEKYESRNMKKWTGDGTITIRRIRDRKKTDIQSMCVDFNQGKYNGQLFDSKLMTLVEGIVEPSLKDQSLIEHFGAGDPLGLAELLFNGEIDEIADAIEEVGKKENVEEVVKN